ncbi:MAG TPA: hypothetical protein VMW48_12540 [Vicinamibacterales bacterium]|nr:hypothetical protein [Vicinamibacterales bacterium]
MSDEVKRVILNQTVIDDTEAQFAGDVEAPWVELVHRAVAPTPTTDKPSSLLYAMADDSVRCKSQAGVELNITDRLLNPVGAFPYQGDIAAAADFPALAAVVNGWTYFLTADATDNGGAPAHTNTLQAFLAGAVISWNGVNWTQTDQGTFRSYAVATPAAVPEGDLAIVEVATTTIGAPSVVNLPALSAAILGKKVLVVDSQGAGATNPITITPNGANTINGAATLVLNTNYGGALLEAAQTGAATWVWVIVANRTEMQVATARLTAIGAGRAQADSRQLAAVSETLRVFRALAAGRLVACAAETGTVAAAGESMTFDVQIAGVTALTGLITVDDTTVIDTPVAGVLGAGAIREFAAGELITVDRVYVAGGGATPMRDTVVDIHLQYD